MVLDNHRIELCYKLHPEKAPAHWTKSPSKKSRGKDNRSRSGERGRKRSNSRNSSRNSDRSSIERHMGALSEEQKKIVVKFAQQTQEAAEKIWEEEEKLGTFF